MDILTDTYNFIVQLPQMLIQLLTVIGTFLFYPLIAIGNFFIAVVAHIFTPMWNLATLLTSMFTQVITLNNTFFSAFMDNTWVTLMLAVLALLLALRIWFFVKGISIAGFKLG